MDKSDIKNKKIYSNKDLNIVKKNICPEKLCNYCLLYCKKRTDALNIFNIVGHIKLGSNIENVLYNN